MRYNAGGTSQKTDPSWNCQVNIFLFGSSNLELKDNIEIYEHVQQYIRESKRFL